MPEEKKNIMVFSIKLVNAPFVAHTTYTSEK